MFTRYIGNFKGYCWSLIYEHRCVADWGTASSQVRTLRINKWTRATKVIDTTVIKGVRSAAYRVA